MLAPLLVNSGTTFSIPTRVDCRECVTGSSVPSVTTYAGRTLHDQGSDPALELGGRGGGGES
jgi:hypothetical protein